MKLYVLTENMASGRFLAEHGLSYFIEHDIKILFDTGHSDVFIQNARRFNIDLEKAGTVILSHGHWDHGSGLKYLNNKRLICHPDAFQKRFHKNDKEFNDLGISLFDLQDKYELITSRKPYNVSDHIIFLGEIPRLNDFESQYTEFILNNDKDDFLNDDSGLVVKLDGEIIVISGCAHSGICNIIDYAKKVSGLEKIRAVIGGFHLKHNDRQTQETIKYFKKQDIKEIYPSHCTELPALCAFFNEFTIKQIKSGMILNF